MHLRRRLSPVGADDFLDPVSAELFAGGIGVLDKAIGDQNEDVAAVELENFRDRRR